MMCIPLKLKPKSCSLGFSLMTVPNMLLQFSILFHLMYLSYFHLIHCEEMTEKCIYSMTHNAEQRALVV